jgi:hypothetical protein
MSNHSPARDYSRCRGGERRSCSENQEVSYEGGRPIRYPCEYEALQDIYHQ